MSDQARRLPGQNETTIGSVARDFVVTQARLRERVITLRRSARHHLRQGEWGALVGVLRQRAEVLDRLGGHRSAQALAWARVAVCAAAIDAPDTFDAVALAQRRIQLLPKRLARRVSRSLLREVESALSPDWVIDATSRHRARAVTLHLTAALGELEQADCRLKLIVDYGEMYSEHCAAALDSLLDARAGSLAAPRVIVDTLPSGRPGAAPAPHTPCQFIAVADGRRVRELSDLEDIYELVTASTTRVVAASAAHEGPEAMYARLQRLITGESLPWSVLSDAIAQGLSENGRTQAAERWRRIGREPSNDAARRSARDIVFGRGNTIGLDRSRFL